MEMREEVDSDLGLGLEEWLFDLLTTGYWTARNRYREFNIVILVVWGDGKYEERSGWSVF